jgi:LL-diaminopimelate aminotransferase
MARKNHILNRLLNGGSAFVDFIENELQTIVEAYRAEHGRPAYTLSFGYTSHPIPPVAARAMSEYSLGLADGDTYTSYEPVSGNPRLKQAIADDYRRRSGVAIDPDAIFITDGAQLASVAVQELFAQNSLVALPDPSYPAFLEGTQLLGRHYIWLPNDEEDPFVPVPPRERADIIYLCSPSNPTGKAATRAQLKRFVDYALEHEAVIIHDAAYRSFVQTEGAPASIYEIEGAEACAIEVGSLSKDAGFAGLRVGWCILPHALAVSDASPGELHAMWCRQHQIKIWGPSNVAQHGALAVFGDEGAAQRQQAVDYYLTNARMLREALERLGIPCHGASDNPYVWAKSPTPGQGDRAFLKQLLDHTGLVGAPGTIFGPGGHGYLRLSGFGAQEEIRKIREQLQHLPPLGIGTG